MSPLSSLSPHPSPPTPVTPPLQPGSSSSLQGSFSEIVWSVALISCSVSVSCRSARSVGAELGSGPWLHPWSLELGLADSVDSAGLVGGFLAQLLEVLGESPSTPDPTAHLTGNGGGWGAPEAVPLTTRLHCRTSWTHMTQVIKEPDDLSTRAKLVSKTELSFQNLHPVNKPRPSTLRRTLRGRVSVGGPPPPAPACGTLNVNGGGDSSPSPARTVLQFIWLLSSRGNPDVSIPALLLFSLSALLVRGVWATGCGGIRTWKIRFPCHFLSSNQVASLGVDSQHG